MILRRLPCQAAFLGLLVLGAQVQANDDSVVRQWLDQMSHALTNLDYQGTVIYLHDGQLDSIQIVHLVDADGEHERLTSLNGAPREVIRTRDRVTCILPGKRSMVLDRRFTNNLFPALPPSQVGDLADYYNFRYIGKDRVAGLEAAVIGIVPEDSYRYGYRLWLEQDTGMLLKSELLDEAGQAVEQVMFTNITLGESISPSALEPRFGEPEFGPKPPPGTKSKTRPTPPATPPHEFRWEAASLPPGFHLKSHEWERLTDTTPLAEHLVFTDGLATVSVYVEELSAGADNPKGGASMGAVSAFTRKMHDHRITVVGEVPPVTARNIANGMHYLGQAVSSND